MQNPPLLDAEGSWEKAYLQKANEFAKCPKQMFQPNEALVPLEFETLSQEDNIHDCSQRKYSKTFVKKINFRRTPGCDLISGEILGKK